jgi:tetratricopeptide (TPR) repeat protein
MRRSVTRGISNRRLLGRIGPVRLALALAVAGAVAVASSAPAKEQGSAKAQLQFGVDMARRGLWNEALFRFEQAQKELPNDSRVLNNLAVAYEAVGRFDDADAAYRQALQVAPGNRDIQKNVTRFREFLQSFRSRRAGTDAQSAPESKQPPSNPAGVPEPDAIPPLVPPPSDPPPGAAR